jgi:hypothetical protein
MKVLCKKDCATGIGRYDSGAVYQACEIEGSSIRVALSEIWSKSFTSDDFDRYFTTDTETKNDPKGNPKYDVTIYGKYGTGNCTVDAYRMIDACEIKNPQLQHLFKKVAFTGKRGHKDERQDLVDIVHSAQSALDMFDDKNP